MIIFTPEVADKLMEMGFVPIGELNGFWEFADSVRLEAAVTQLVEAFAHNDL